MFLSASVYLSTWLVEKELILRSPNPWDSFKLNHQRTHFNTPYPSAHTYTHTTYDTYFHTQRYFFAVVKCPSFTLEATHTCVIIQFYACRHKGTVQTYTRAFNLKLTSHLLNKVAIPFTISIVVSSDAC